MSFLMLNLTEIKTGKRILFNEEPYVVLDYQHSKMGRAGAVLRTKLKNLLSGSTIDHTFQGADKVDEAEMGREKAQYLYRENDEFAFMDMSNYDQFSLPADVIGEFASYLIEGVEVTMLTWNGRPINIEIPVKVTLKVVDAPPGIRGDTALGGIRW